MKKQTIKIVPMLAIMLTALLTLTMLAVPVSATGAHLWFYSVDPTTIGYPPLRNPEISDPNYVDADPDPWLTESVVFPQGDWDTPFSLWIGNADPQDDCYDTTLVISVNDAAAAAIDSIFFGETAASPWNTDPADFPLPSHGISDSAEYYGFTEVVVGKISSGSYIQVTIDISLNPGADLDEAKIHFDAYGWSDEAHTGDYDIRNPFSHDYTFVIPELATILLTMAPMSAFGIYAYKRKHK